MAVVETREYHSLASFDDPDDYRPDSELAIVIDPSRSEGRFAGDLTVFYERIAPGDRIPLHRHTIEEVFFLDEGRLEVTLGEDRRTIEAGAVVFIAAGQEHGFRNVGEDVARIHAVFPSNEITIEYLERNPAPGTEGDEPAPPVAIDVRELLEGDPGKAVREVG
jgi:mannose-6-phosphate isomerase-like protein (cupin superfamily)